MIRVSVGARSVALRATLESAIRSSTSLEFGEALDPSQFSSADFSGDVLLVAVEDPDDYDWPALADLPIPVLLLLDSNNSAVLSAALRSGIRGAISWDGMPEELEAAVLAIKAGLAVTTPALLAELLPRPPLAHQLAEPLSDRELEVLDLLAEGLSNKLIAHRLSISEHTVKTHVAAIFAKLGVASRTEAVSQAIRRGLVML